MLNHDEVNAMTNLELQEAIATCYSDLRGLDASRARARRHLQQLEEELMRRENMWYKSRKVEKVKLDERLGCTDRSRNNHNSGVHHNSVASDKPKIAKGEA